MYFPLTATGLELIVENQLEHDRTQILYSTLPKNKKKKTL